MTIILVDPDLCTRCGICSEVCPMSIIEPADEKNLPKIRDEIEVCIACGHCEAFCPSQALLLNLRPDEKVDLPDGAGELPAGDLGWYLKKRRSVRHFTGEPVSREDILQVLDIARYAASGCNGQPVEWIVIHDPERVNRIAGLTIDWMRTLVGTSHPLSNFVTPLISAWEAGYDPICRNAPHMIISHIPEDNPMNIADAIIALTHFDISAPAFGIGTCWAGFVAHALLEYRPLQEEIALPKGRIPSFAIFFGHPKYQAYGIPRRKPLQVTWL